VIEDGFAKGLCDIGADGSILEYLDEFFRFGAVLVCFLDGDDVGLIRNGFGGRILAKDDPAGEFRSESGQGRIAWDYSEIVILEGGAKLSFFDAGKRAILIAARESHSAIGVIGRKGEGLIGVVV